MHPAPNTSSTIKGFSIILNNKLQSKGDNMHNIAFIRTGISVFLTLFVLKVNKRT